MKWKDRLLPLISFDALVRRAVSSWLWSAWILLLIRPGFFNNTGFLKDMTWGLPLLLFCGFFVIFTALAWFFTKRADGFWMLLGLSVSAVLWGARTKLDNEEKWLFGLVVIGVFAFVLWDFVSQNVDLLCKFSPKSGFALCAGIFCGGLLALVIGLTTVFRYLNFNAPTYDFGIFVQMFHNMAESLEPLTTLERNELLSHFSVHLSPIYYLILPFYFVFRSPVTLQVAQALIIASGIVPFFLLMRRLGHSPKVQAAFAFLYLLFPTIAKGCFFDIHENCFMLPLMLWLIWAYEAEKLPLIALFSVLVTLIKEDAAVYVVIFALYILITGKDKKKKLTGLFMALYGIIYFAFAVWYIETFGLGIMSSRYNNVSADGTLVGVIFTAFANPGFFFEEILARGWGSVQYILTLLIPMGFLPIATEKKARWILLSPMLLNLITAYPYQLELKYQYHFGITAFLFYLALLNLREWKGKASIYMTSIALAGSFVFFFYTIIPTLGTQTLDFSENHERFEVMEAVLEKIPQDASVNASTMLTPHLADREEIYDIDYHDSADTDLVILDNRPGHEGSTVPMQANCLAEGYSLIAETETLLIYASPDWEGDRAGLLSEIRSVAEVLKSDEGAPLHEELPVIFSLLPEGATLGVSSGFWKYLVADFEVYQTSRELKATADIILLDIRSGYGTNAEEMLRICHEAGYRCLGETYCTVICISPDPSVDLTAFCEGVSMFIPE